jgi:hypothetical protein
MKCTTWVCFLRIHRLIISPVPQKYHGLDFISDLLQLMHVADFTKRPTVEKILHEWYNIRLLLDEEAMENTRLCVKGGAKRPTSCEQSRTQQSSPSGSTRSTKSGSGSARSNKRDISSILNKVRSHLLIGNPFDLTYIVKQ